MHKNMVVLSLLLIPKCIAFQTKTGFFHPLNASSTRCCRTLVSLHGHISVATTARRRQQRKSGPTTTTTTTTPVLYSERTHALIGDERPVDPRSIDPAQVEEAALRLADWWSHSTTSGNHNNNHNNSVLCLTGAGISTESGIPDYRGAQGSYHTGHQPMRHDQFVTAHHHHFRQRYWGRGLVGFEFLDARQPAAGHVALATLERHQLLGVSVPHDDDDRNGSVTLPQQRQVSVITQNVDSLHRRAGTRHLVELHGRTDQVECLHCGHTQSRRSFHQELETHNREWFLKQQQQQQQQQAASSSTMRADGDAQIPEDYYRQLHIPNCQNCHIGILKPSVVFFGDSVPRHRVQLCEAVVERCDKLLVVGSSLAVHSAFRHVRAAHQQDKDICILNVGTTRAEVEGLLATNNNSSSGSHLPRRLKLEAPAGPVLQRVVELLLSKDH